MIYVGCGLAVLASLVSPFGSSVAKHPLQGGRSVPLNDGRQPSVQLDTNRTDAEISAAIRAALRKSRIAVHVSVLDGKAVLTGEVASEAERGAAELAAWRGGAQAVENRLLVATTPPRAP